MTRWSVWREDHRLDPARLTRAKAVLVAVIAVTSLLPLVFVQPDDAPWHVNLVKYLAKTGAFVGSSLLVWQFLLGFRGLVSSRFPDLTWVVDLHKRLGQFGVPIILLHPIFIGVYYRMRRDENVFALDLGEPFSWFVLLGMVALAITALVVVVSIWMRGTLGFGRWLTTHLASYLIPPLLFVHSFALGPTIEGTPLRWWWIALTALVALALGWRLLHALGVGGARHRTTGVREVADGTTEIELAPEGRPLAPELGQFVYLRPTTGERAHPFTVSGYDDATGALAVTVSEAGPRTQRLQRTRPGDRFVLDGPYGVFTRVAMHSELPLVMIAGGVGITPFRRIWQRLECDRDREAHLFYGNPTRADIAYADELDALEHVDVVHVLSDEDDYDGETGNVDVDLLRRRLPGDLRECVYLVCGPPPMILALEEGLKEAGVPDERVRFELFSN